MEAGTEASSWWSQRLNPAGRSPGLLRRRVILVAHHEAVIRNRMAITMGAEGNLVLCACDGHGALAASHERGGTIDLAITDVMLPGLGSSDLCSRLLRERPGIEILVMSGTDGTELEGPEDGFPPPPSPFDAHLLSIRVRAILATPRGSLPFVHMIFFEKLPAFAAVAERLRGSGPR